jgi:seryl-tRNA synthetase
MLDIRIIRENPELIKKGLKRRNEDDSVIDKLQEIDKGRLEIIQKIDDLKSIRNKASDEIAVMKRNNENSDVKVIEMRELSDVIKTLEPELREIDKSIEELLIDIPNIPDESVPDGKDADDNIEIKKWSEKKDFDFKIKDHIELTKKLDILDFDRGTKISGSGFPLYKGKGAQLERALINLMLDTHIANNYKEVMVPVFVNRASMEAAEKVPKFEEDMYQIEKDDLFAIPTAEIPILNIHRNEILDQKILPLKYCSYTPCFRREAGSYGKDTRGLIRGHQFNKVELFNFCSQDSSYIELDKMLNDACSILEMLNIHYRILDICTGDMGFSAAKQYDIEVWSHAEQRWLEASSVSNCTDFQSRRGKIRYKKASQGKSKTEFVHLLNGSGLATSRLMVSLLETYQNKDGSISVPEALIKYTGFEVIN